MRILEDDIKVYQLMTKKVIVGNVSNRFSQILEFFTASKIHHLPIVENDELHGVISYTDVLGFIGKQLQQGKSLSLADLDKAFVLNDVMTKKVVTISADALVDDATKLLAGNTFQALPVVDGNNKLVGIVSNKDIVRFYDEF